MKLACEKSSSSVPQLHANMRGLKNLIWAQRERESCYHQQADKADSHDARPLPRGEGRGRHFRAFLQEIGFLGDVTGGETRLLLAVHSHETTTAPEHVTNESLLDFGYKMGHMDPPS